MPLIKDQIYIYVDKASQRYVQGSLDSDVDHKGVAHPFMATPIGYAGNRFVTFLEANTLARAQDIKKYYPDVSPELVKMIRATKKTDNPIILLYSVRF